MRSRSVCLCAAVAAAALGFAAAACGPDQSGSNGSENVTVFATASLTAAFTEIGDAFKTENPGTTVILNFAGSSALVTQIREGAPADVFASADQNNMSKLVDSGDNATEPVVFTTNLAEIIVGDGNPTGITEVADLADDDVIVVLCAPEVPCGNYAEQVFANAEVSVTPRSFEENVKGVVTKVSLGEADAGIVYATDVIAAGDAVDGVEIPGDVNVIAEYPIAVTADASNPAGGQAFVEFVLGERGQAILATHGFVAP